MQNKDTQHANTQHANTWQPISPYNVVPIISLIKRELIREWSTKHFSLLPELMMIVVFCVVIKTMPLPDSFVVNGMEYLTFVGYGLITNTMITSSFGSTAFGLLHAKMEHYLIDFILPPLSKTTMYLSLMLTATISAALSALCITVILLMFGLTPPPLSAIPSLLLLYGMVGASFALLGIVAARHSKDWDALFAKLTLMLTPLLYLSGIFYSIESIDPNFQWILNHNPIYHLFATVRELVLGQPPSTIGLYSIAGVIVACVVFSYCLLVGREIK